MDIFGVLSAHSFIYQTNTNEHPFTGDGAANAQFIKKYADAIGEFDRWYRAKRNFGSSNKRNRKKPTPGNSNNHGNNANKNT